MFLIYLGLGLLAAFVILALVKIICELICFIGLKVMARAEAKKAATDAKYSEAVQEASAHWADLFMEYARKYNIKDNEESSDGKNDTTAT